MLSLVNCTNYQQWYTNVTKAFSTASPEYIVLYHWSHTFHLHISVWSGALQQTPDSLLVSYQLCQRCIISIPDSASDNRRDVPIVVGVLFYQIFITTVAHCITIEILLRLWDEVSNTMLIITPLRGSLHAVVCGCNSFRCYTLISQQNVKIIWTYVGIGSSSLLITVNVHNRELVCNKFALKFRLLLALFPPRYVLSWNSPFNLDILFNTL